MEGCIMIKPNVSLFKSLGILREVRLSASFCDQINDQSCDCDSVILSGDHETIYPTYHASGEDGYIEIKPANTCNLLNYPLLLDLEGKVFCFDEMCYHDDGSIWGIRFRADDTFLFIFGSEYNLILTMSKYDLFESIDMNFPEKEATLHILCGTDK